MSKDYKMLINGEWVSSDEKIEVLNPYNGTVLGTVPKATKSDLDNAIKAAEEGFKVISKMPAYQRSKILENTARLIEEQQEEIARTISLEAGKSIKYSRMEVSRSVETFKFASEEAKQIHGETVPMDASKAGEGRMGFFLRVPKGVIGAITPFNFPLNLVAHKVAPAIAAGNSVVLKPATATPITSIKLGEIMIEAGLPKGVLNIVTGRGSELGDWIVTDDRIAMITFTGSLEVGKRIKSMAGIKPVTLELGSNSAVIIDEGVNPGQAVPRCIMGGFANSGQVCISVQRIYVHQSIEKKFTEEFVASIKKLNVGNPLDSDVEFGPMIDEKEARRIEEWIDEAVKQGAKVLTGGKRNGSIVQATVLTDVTADMKVIKDETFAPVVSIIPFKNFEEAVSMVNNSIYGLNAGVYTNNLRNAIMAAKEIKVGGVIINDVPTFRVDQMPYGGVKSSGIGREGLKYAIEEMTDIKMIVFNV